MDELVLELVLVDDVCGPVVCGRGVGVGSQCAVSVL